MTKHFSKTIFKGMQMLNQSWYPTTVTANFRVSILWLTLQAKKVRIIIIGASGSDKEMLCASSGERAALSIAAEKK